VAAAEAFFRDPSSSDYWLRIRRWEEGAERLKQRHRDAPMRHRAPGIGCHDALECLPRLRIRHVMQECDRAVELGPSLFRAGHGEVDGAERVPAMLGLGRQRGGFARCNDRDVRMPAAEEVCRARMCRQPTARLCRSATNT
jgi:hypothetical protein